MNKLICNHNNYNKDNDINILYDINHSYNVFTDIINIYDPNAEEPMHKFWLLIDKGKVIRKMNNYIYVTISNKERKFIDFLKLLDKKIDSIVKKLYPSTTSFRESLNIKKNVPTIIKLNLDESSFIFDINNNKTDIVSINDNSNISACIELSSVVIRNRTCYKNWNVLQIKKRKSIDLTKSIFDIPNKQPLLIINKPPIINNTPNITSTPIKKQEPTTKCFRQCFSMDELVKAKSKLKKTTINNKKVDNCVKIINPMVNLKKVKTREPINIVEQMKKDRQTIEYMKNKLDEYKESIKNENIDNMLDRKYKKLNKRYKKLNKNLKVR
jgi:hypothetical protein